MGHGGIQVDTGVLLQNRFLVVTVAFLGRIIGALGEGQIEIANGGRHCAIGEVPGLKASRWDDVSVLNILENGLVQVTASSAVRSALSSPSWEKLGMSEPSW